MLFELLMVGLLLQMPSTGESQAQDEEAESAGFASQRCAVGAMEGRCGTVTVRERHDGGGTRELELFVAVVPARGDNRLPDPIVVLEGGPGASVTHFSSLHVQTFAAAMAQRDLVLIDQRGTGRSAPLDCDLMDEFRSLPTPESARTCVDDLAAQADLAHYTTEDAVLDLDLVLDRLGYSQINLFAVSNGTRTALRFLAHFPERVRTVTLLAPYPTTHNVLLEAAETLDHSLETLIAACGADAQCTAGYPDLEGAPARLARTFGDEADWARFSSGVRMMLFFPMQASNVPQLFDLVERGGRLPEPRSGPQDALFAGWISQGAFMSILCSEDASRTTVEAVRERSLRSFLGPGWAESLLRSCEQWPRKPLPDGFAEPVRAATQALLLVGGLDPAMPPPWAHEVAQSLPNARVVEIPEGQHSFVGMSGVGCVVRLISHLIETGRADSLEPGCVASMRRPPFASPAR